MSERLARRVRGERWRLALVAVGVLGFASGVVRAFADHNSTPTIIVGACLAVAGLVLHRVDSAEVTWKEASAAVRFRAVELANVAKDVENAAEGALEAARVPASGDGMADDSADAVAAARARVESLTASVEQSKELRRKAELVAVADLAEMNLTRYFAEAFVSADPEVRQRVADAGAVLAGLVAHDDPSKPRGVRLWGMGEGEGDRPSGE